MAGQTVRVIISVLKSDARGLNLIACSLSLHRPARDRIGGRLLALEQG